MTYVKKMGLLAFLIGASLFSFAQEKNVSVIATAGGTSKGSNVILEWTVGEPVVETVSNGAAVYTQGFHQPILQVQRWKNENDVAIIKSSIRVYPNPTAAVVNIQLEKSLKVPLHIALIDMTGKTLFNNTVNAGALSQKINVSRLSQGAYLLRITDAKGTVQEEYKIIKAQ